MPKPTFQNLPKEKKEALIKAGKKEFSRVPLYEASVSKIIKDAGIPRGSFYQYFDDKEDLFYFLLDEYSKRNYEQFLSILRINNGDLFVSIIDWFKSILIMFEEPENRQYFKNAFLNMNYKIEKSFTQDLYGEKVKTRYTQIIGLIDKDNLNVKNEKEIYHMFKIMLAVTFQNLVHVFAWDLPVSEVMKIYSLEIELLKKGFYKEAQ